MSDLVIPPEKIVKEGIDLITQTAKDTSLRDLGMEMLSYGIRALERCNQSDPHQFSNLIDQCRVYHDNIAREWKYECNEKRLDYGWHRMYDFCYGLYQQYYSNSSDEKTLRRALQRCYIYLLFRKDLQGLSSEESSQIQWMESILDEFQRSGTFNRTSFEEWKSTQGSSSGDGDLNIDRLPTGDLNMDKLPGDDLNLDRVPVSDINLSKLPGDDLNMDRLPIGDDLNMDRLPIGDDLNMDRLPIGDDLNTDRLPTSDLNIDRLPTGDSLNLNNLPGNDLNVDRLPSGDGIPDTLPSDIPIDVPIPEIIDIPVEPNEEVQSVEVNTSVDPAEALHSSSHSNYSTPSQGLSRKSIPKCPKIQDLDKPRKKKTEFPSVPVVSPLAVDKHSYPTSSVTSRGTILPSPPNISVYQTDSSVQPTSSRDSIPPLPDIAVDLYHRRNISADYSQNYGRGTSSVSSRGSIDSMDRHILPSPGQGCLPNPGIVPILSGPIVAPSPNSFVSNPGVFFTEADVELCCSKLNRISSTLSYYCQLNPELYSIVNELEQVKNMLMTRI